MAGDKIIGGEFDIDVNHLYGGCDKSFLNEGYLYSSGRAAFYNILVFIQKKITRVRSLYLPDYLCHSVVEMALRTGNQMKFYPLNDQLEIDRTRFEAVFEKGGAVLLINYFGLQALTDQITYLRNLDKDVCIIEDNVQSFFSMFDESDADFRFTSFRKTLPVPDGGWVKTKYKMEIPTEENSFVLYKTIGGVLKFFRKYDDFNDQVYLDLLEAGENVIDANLDKKISKFTIDLFSGIDIDQVAILRKRNAVCLIAGLSSLGIKPVLAYCENKIPLFIPILLSERDAIRKKLFDSQIFCPVHWPVLSVFSGELTKGNEMAGCELSIVVDQRNGVGEMNRILEVLDSAIHGK